MKIIIENSSSVPLYEQIKNSIKAQIIDGKIDEDEQLPSIRSLAKDLKISILTVKKAYDELESEGYLKSVQGKGSFVSSKNDEFIKEERLKELENHMREIIKISNLYEISKEELYDLFEFIYRSESDGE